MFNTEAKLHFAYASKNVTNNATGKNWMSKTLSLQNFLSNARQIWVYIIANNNASQLWRISRNSQFEKKKKFTN